jgi:hypothetical protein
MARENVPFLSFNRGIISPKSLARVDLDRTRLSAEIMTNWLPKTQGAMSLRPGTKYFGSSLRDTGAEFIEFVASTDDVALIELTDDTMRVWLGDDAHALALLSRPKVDTTLTLTDTGWSNTSVGGASAISGVDVLPIMTGYTTAGVTVSASSEINATRVAWRAADDIFNTSGNFWQSVDSNPAWWKVNFGADTGNRKAIAGYSISGDGDIADVNYLPKRWELITANWDTGTFAIDTGKWTLEDAQSAEINWVAGEKRLYNLPGADTGTVEPRRYWRLSFKENNGAPQFLVGEFEFFSVAQAQQAALFGTKRILNATSIGAHARLEKHVIVSDTGTEHALAIDIEHGPVTLRVGSSQRGADYIAETTLGTGYHNLAFTPLGNFYVTLQSDALTNKIIRSFAMSDSGTVELTTPWTAADLANIRYDQSADVVFVDCADVRPSRIERRGTGRSWSVVDYAPNNGPFLGDASSTAKLKPSFFFGNTRITSDLPFFTPDHVGALLRIFSNGQSGIWRLGAIDAATDTIEVTGIGDTGTPTTTNERRLTISVSGSYTGGIAIERSFDGPEVGFKPAPSNFGADTGIDTGTFSRNIDDQDDNIKVWYRARLETWSTGVAVVNIHYGNGGVTGIARVTDYNSNQEVEVEVLSRFSDTGASADWQESYWSDHNGFPTAVALHGGRLAHAQGGSVFLSVSDDYDNFDEETTGDAAPIIRTLGSGPVDSIHFLVSLLRLIIGTTGAEIMMRSSSLDEPLTPTNSSAGTFSTQGSTSLRAVKMDNRAIFVQRSGQRLFMIGAGSQGSTFGDYEAQELTLLVPELLQAGVVSIAVQRQPDTRIHCVLADGRVAIFTYEPGEEVQCWTLWESDTGSSPTVEKAVTLPGTNEDAVYYHVRRTINGTTQRYLEKWAKESECNGDTGFCFLMDCAITATDTGRALTFNQAALHLAGRSAIAWGDLDTGTTPYVDLSPDVSGTQRRYAVDTGGDVDLTAYGATHGVHKVSVGLTYHANWKSAKLSYAAQAGTALAQMKRSDKIAFVLYQTHNRGLLFGSDTGHLDPLPQVSDGGAVVDPDKVFESFDQAAMPFPGLWDTDSRMYLRAQAPRPCTVLAAVPTVKTSEKV